MQESSIVKGGLALLLLLVIGVAGWVLFFPKENEVSVQPTTTQVPAGETPALTQDSIPQNVTPTLTGVIVESSELSGTQDTRILLSVPNESGTRDEYKFFFSKEKTKGMDTVKGGDTVTVSYTGGSSAVDYMLADGVELVGKE